MGGIVLILVRGIMYLNEEKIISEGGLGGLESVEEGFKYGN